jgi:ParB-like nuclease domain
MKIALKDIINNPHRDLSSNPLNEEKIEKLSASIKSTGFWDNVLVRKSEDHPGKYEIVYGHHRVEAARRAGLNEADFIVKKLSYDMMLEIMSRENDETYGNDLRSTMEAVAALVKSVATGKIDAKKIAPADGEAARTDMYRFAPFYMVGKKPSNPNFPLLPYTTLSVAKFLGFARENSKTGEFKPEQKVIAALAALEMQEAKLWTKADLGKFRTADGVIPVSSVISGAQDSRNRAALAVERATVRHQQAKAAADIMRAQLATGEAERRANDEEQQRLIKSRAAKKKLNAEQKVRAEAEDRRARAAAEEERMEHVKQTKKEQERIDREIADSEAARIKAEKAAEHAAAAQWLSRCKALREKVDRILTNEDSLHAELAGWVRDKRVTDNQRAELLLALQKLSHRADEMSVRPTAPARS